MKGHGTSKKQYVSLVTCSAPSIVHKVDYVKLCDWYRRSKEYYENQVGIELVEATILENFQHLINVIEGLKIAVERLERALEQKFVSHLSTQTFVDGTSKIERYALSNEDFEEFNAARKLWLEKLVGPKKKLLEKLLENVQLDTKQPSPESSGTKQASLPSQRTIGSSHIEVPPKSMEKLDIIITTFTNIVNKLPSTLNQLGHLNTSVENDLSYDIRKIIDNLKRFKCEKFLLEYTNELRPFYDEYSSEVVKIANRIR